MKTEKIKLVFGDGERRKNSRFPDNHRADDILTFTVGDSDDYSYGILEGCTGDARYRIKYDKDCPHEEYLHEFEGHHNEGCFYTLGIRLSAICSASYSGYDILLESYDAPENPIMSYRYIDDDHGTLSVWYPDPDVPWAEGVKPIEAVVSKKDLLEAFYVGFIDQIIKYYDGVKWFFDNDGYFGDKESNLYTFFHKNIDNYLRENGVKDIDEKVQKAKDRIKADLGKIYEEWDRLYNKKDED